MSFFHWFIIGYIVITCGIGYTLYWLLVKNRRDQRSEYRRVWSEDTNKIDEAGGPYRVKLPKE